MRRSNSQKQASSRFTFWYVLGSLALLFLLNFVWLGHTPAASGPRPAPYSQFLAALEAKQVQRVAVGPSIVVWQQKDGGAYVATRLPGTDDRDLLARLEASGAEFEGFSDHSWLGDLLGWLIPIVLLSVVWWYFSRRLADRAQQALSFGKNRAKIHDRGDVNVTFKDVAGVDEAVAELREIVDFLKNPAKYQRLGGRIPKGVLLVGPPGTGKTLLAKATAGEAGVPFFAMSASEFVEMFVGVGAARVRDLFEQAKQKAPCIVFIDELDTIGRHRGGAVAWGTNEEREQTLNQLLVEMDGFESSKGVIIMAATNRPDVLDPALLRPGRFDRQIVVDKPDLEGREAILRVHARHVRLAPDVDLRVIAARTPGFAGAELANVVNEAALLAARAGREAVTQADLEEAIDRVMAGLERKRRVLSDEERDRVAYHEMGHALVASLLPHADPVHKVSIVARGAAALGMTLQLPLADRYLYTRDQLLDRLTVLLGGRAAEELVFGQPSSGAQNDLHEATVLARQMVRDLGMSERIGPLSFDDGSGARFLNGGPDWLARPPYSEATAQAIDLEVCALVEDARRRARALLEEHREVLDALAAELKQREVMTGAELKERIAAARSAHREAGTAQPLPNGVALQPR
jgi:cell division protease FtsH